MDKSTESEPKIILSNGKIEITIIPKSQPKIIQINVDKIFNKLLFIINDIRIYGIDHAWIEILSKYKLPIELIKDHVLESFKHGDYKFNTDSHHYVLTHEFPNLFTYFLHISKDLIMQSTKPYQSIDIPKKDQYEIQKLHGKINELSRKISNLKQFSISDRIHKTLPIVLKKFPHLSIHECSDLIQRCIALGGKIQVHSGKYQRIIVNDLNPQVGAAPTTGRQIYIWLCCPYIYIGFNGRDRFEYYLIRSKYASVEARMDDPWELESLDGDYLADNSIQISEVKKENSKYIEDSFSFKELGLITDKPGLIKYSDIVNTLKNRIFCVKYNNIKDIDYDTDKKKLNEYIYHYGSRDPISPCLNSDTLDLSNI